MTNKYDDIFNYAALARSSYADLSKIRKKDDFEKIKSAIKDYDGSEEFARRIASKYDVLAHYKDRDDHGINPIGSILSIFNSESGFSGTLFRDKGTQEYVMAFKGTDGAKDLWITDVADIVSNGAAHNQIIDMYNFWQQIIHSGEKINGKPATYQAAYLQFDHEFNLRILEALQDHEPNSIEVQEIKSEAISKGYYVADGNIYKVAFRQSDKIYNDDRAFVYNDKINIAKVTATGHSLGGHLAAIFSRLFPEYTSHVYMFNGAGTGGKNSLVPTIFDGISASDNTDNLLNGLAKGYSKFERDKIYNLTGDKGMNLVTIDQNWALSQPGKQLPIFIESKSKDTLGHGMGQVLDSSAVISLLASLDKRFETMPLEESLAFFNRLLDASPGGTDVLGTLENVINKLSEQLTGKNPDIKTGDRDAFYNAIESLKKDDQAKEKLSGQAGLLNIFDELEKNKSVAYDKSELGDSYRYALKHLNAFVIPADTIGRNKDKTTISLLDTSESDTYGGMTEEYIRHRLNMLQLLSKNEEDPLYIYKDYTSQIAIASSKTVDYIRSASVIFGTDGDDKNGVLSHTPNNDYIFSGTGNDFLNGGKGSDYLEGSTGHDIYQLKTGDDGVDTIFDSDGDGVLEVDGTLLSRLEFVSTPEPFPSPMNMRWTPFRTRDGQYQFLKYDDDQWEFSVKNASGNYQPLARIRHWKEGDFGFTLAEDNTLLSDEGAVLVDDSNKAHLFFYNGAMAPRGIRVKGSNLKPSQITGSAHDDVLFTGDGGPKGLHLVMAGQGNDFVYGGNNQEFIFSGNLRQDATNDNDTVYAGGGSDIVIGGAGADTLVAGDGKEDFEKTQPGDETNTETASRQGKRGDWLNGHFGSDVVIGSAQDDVLTAGEGDDTVRGGAGNDLILGDANYLPTTSSVSLGTMHGAAEGTIIEWRWLADGGEPRRLDGSLSVPGEKTFAWEWRGTETDFKIMPGIRLMLQERVQGTGNDTLHGGAGNDWMAGQAGNDEMHGDNGDDTMYGDDAVAMPERFASGDDQLYAGKGKDKLHGGAGNDLLDASDDDHDKDELSGDEGDDQLNGGTGGDELNGGAGNDVLRAGKDKTLMDGGIGNDIYFGNSGDDTMTDQDGDDHYHISAGTDSIKDTAGNDGYHIMFSRLMPPGVTTIHDSNGKGFITYNGRAITNDGVRAVAENEWVTDIGAKLTREGSNLVITNGPKGSQGKVVFTGFFNSEEFLGLKLPSLDDDNKPSPDPKPDPDPKPEQPQAPTAGKPLAAQSIHEKDKLSYTLAEDTFHTANQDDKLSYSARLADGKPLPKWLNFDAATRTFSGTPGNDDVGTLDIEISARGKGGSASQHLALNVINVNDAPQIDAAIADYTGESGKPLQYRIPANAFKDIDKDDTLALSAKQENGEPLPSWLTFDEKTGQFNGTPPLAHTANTWRIAVTATDNAGAQVSQTFSLITTAAATNIIRGTGKESIIQGTAGNDTIYAGDNTFTGANYNKIYGNDGDDVIYSGSGRDRLYGGAGNDILYTDGAEYDSLYGGYGDDIYRIGADFREVLVKNFDLDQYDWRPQRHDVIEFAAHKRDDFNIFNYGDNLYLKTRDGKEVGIYDQFSNQGNNWHYINEIRFTDKTLTAADIKAMRINGTAGNDTLSAKTEGSWLYGKQGDDHLFSGQGNDYLDGGAGNDTYHFARGFGYDLINNENYGSRHDSIVFSDMNRDDFDIYRENTSLVLRSKDGKDQITVRNHFLLSWQIDSIRFADGTTLDHDAINSLTNTQNAPQGNYMEPAAQALQMNQAIASLNGQAQPLDALATPDLQPRPLLAAGNP